MYLVRQRGERGKAGGNVRFSKDLHLLRVSLVAIDQKLRLHVLSKHRIVTGFSRRDNLCDPQALAIQLGRTGVGTTESESNTWRETGENRVNGIRTPFVVLVAR